MTDYKMKKDYIIKKNGLYHGDKNITKVLPTCMQEFVKIDKDVTLRDIFKMLNKHKEFFSTLFFGHYCKEYIEYALKIRKNQKQSFSKLIIHISSTLDHSYKKKNLYDVSYVFYTDGIKGKVIYAIDLSDLKDIIDTPITITDGQFTDMLTADDGKAVDSIKISSEPTLYEFLNSILNEISFHGLPGDNKKMKDTLDSYMDELGMQKSKDVEVINC